jgi:hypothetical protein
MHDRRYGGTRTGTARRVLEALPCGYPGPGTTIGFPIPDAGSGTLRLGKQGWRLLRELHYDYIIRKYKLNLRVERRAAMGVNFLPCVLDQRSVLPQAWQDWLPEGIWPRSS